jgi:hypothetical protein
MDDFLRVLKGNFRRKVRVKLEDHYLVCFFVGLIAGTVIANVLYPSFRKEAGFYFQLLDTNLHMGREERMVLFEQVVSQRLFEVGIAWLIGLTAYAFVLFCLFTAFIGFGMGFILSMITVQKGIMGIIIFLMTITPQILFYIPLWCLLLFCGVKKKRRFRILALFLLVLFTVVGSVCEAWLNPYFLRIVL